ncbi:MAG TPA: FkbM family methyltransferase [Vicinamibacterales bacterium]|nr:FkbM family methyltransferase [Vicinamibacterales bacterium]
MNTACVSSGALLSRYITAVPALARALFSETVVHRGLRLRIAGPVSVRVSVLAGNARMCAIFDRYVHQGATVIDVGANIGVTAAYAARRVGITGCVHAVEPAPDNLDVLRQNLRQNRLSQVRVCEVAAGRRRETRQFFLRGDVSAVNSLFPESVYAAVTAVNQVDVRPLDDLVEGPADFVKIDVEGAELDVLAGMPRLLAYPRVHLAVEWHPLLQRAAGYAPDALPRMLLDGGFRVDAVDHLSCRPLTPPALAPLAERLLRTRRPVELLARR